MADDNEFVEEKQQVVAVESEVAVETAVEKPLGPPKYEVRPLIDEKFQAQNVRNIINTIMQEQLTGRAYCADQAMLWAQQISNAVRQRAQDLDMKRYKLVVRSTVIEIKIPAPRIKCEQRCIWDPETDIYVVGTFRNDSIFCHTVAYGVYMY